MKSCASPKLMKYFC